MLTLLTASSDILNLLMKEIDLLWMKIENCEIVLLSLRQSRADV